MDNQFETLQITMDGFAEILSEIKAAVQSLNDKDNGDSALNTDLLNKIIQTIDESKKGITAEELQVHSEAIVASVRQLQDEANTSFSQFLDEKIAELEQIVKQPSIVKNYYSIDFKSSRMFIAVLCISLGLLCSLCGNYNQYQKNQQLTNNDLKYRFVKMRNGILPDEITRLENFFYYPDSAYVVDNIRKEVIDYEHRMVEQARKLEQKRQSEEAIDKLDREIEKLK